MHAADCMEVLKIDKLVINFILLLWKPLSVQYEHVDKHTQAYKFVAAWQCGYIHLGPIVIMWLVHLTCMVYLACTTHSQMFAYLWLLASLARIKFSPTFSSYLLSSSVSLLGYAVPGVWHICAAALFPLVIIKVPINLLILKVGCQGIAAVDIAERSQWNKWLIYTVALL